MNGWRRCGVSNSGILLSHEEEGNSAMFDSMDEPEGCHAKWSKSGRDRQVLRVITYTWNLKKKKKLKLTETESRNVVARVGVEEIERGWSKSTYFQLCGD